MATTKDKLTFVAAMSRHTSATVRQCEALMRYAGTLWRLERDYSLSSVMKRDRIRERIRKVCHDICELNHNIPCHCAPEFTSPKLVIRVRPSGEGIVVPS